MRLTIIAAVAENGVIGADGEMPWHHPEDLQAFKERTLGQPVIMGRVTYEAIVDRIGGPLPGRTNIVLTRTPERVDASHRDVHVAETVDEAIELARQKSEGERSDEHTAQAGDERRKDGEAFVAGGGSVYEQFLPVADRMVLTEIHERHEGDTTFPEWDERNWQEVERDEREALSFVTYRRVTNR